MKRDPLDTTISLILNLNLLEKNEQYNINELKTLKNLDFHWNTIFKYLKLFNLVKKYCPNFELNESKLHITNTIIFDRLNEKEKLVLYLFNRNAISSESAIEIPERFYHEDIKISIGVLFEMLDTKKFYLNKAGLDIYRSIKQNLINLLFNERPIEEVFPKLDFYEFEKFSDKINVYIDNINPSLNLVQNNIYILEKEKNISEKRFEEILL